MKKVKSKYNIEYKVYDGNQALLDHVWQEWNCQALNKNHIFETHYTHVYRSSNRAQAFEDWLYEQGAFVVQKNGERFLRFYDDDRAIMFMLRWA